MRVVVVGAGNRFRRDDGVGAAALELLDGRLPAGVDALESDGEATRMIDAWEGADVAVVVEAVRQGAAPGTVIRLLVDGELDAPGTRDSASGSHDLGFGAAIALGRALGRLPRRLVIVGVEPGDLGHGEGLSPAVQASLADVVATVLDEVSVAS